MGTGLRIDIWEKAVKIMADEKRLRGSHKASSKMAAIIAATLLIAAFCRQIYYGDFDLAQLVLSCGGVMAIAVSIDSYSKSIASRLSLCYLSIDGDIVTWNRGRGIESMKVHSIRSIEEGMGQIWLRKKRHFGLDVAVPSAGFDVAELNMFRDEFNRMAKKESENASGGRQGEV
jgi:hypothetical protein